MLKALSLRKISWRVATLFTLLPLSVYAEDDYIIQLSDDGTTLTYTYGDTSTASWTLDVWCAKNTMGSEYNMSSGQRACVTKVVIDKSFASAHPETTAKWFWDLSNLTAIEGLENLNTGSVTDMYEMFAGCSSLQSLDLSSFNTQAVTSMHEMFVGCSSLQSVDLSSFDTKNVTDMVFMFAWCRSLQSLDLSGFDTKNVTSMQSMFYGCSSLQNLDVSCFDTSNVTDVRDMFSNCTALQELNIGNIWRDSYDTNYFLCNVGSAENPCRLIVGSSFDSDLGEAKINSNGISYYEWKKGCVIVIGDILKLSDDGATLTFAKDDYATATWTLIQWCNNASARIVSMTEKQKKTVTKVVFDKTFAEARSTTTAQWFANLSNLTTIESIENLNTSSTLYMNYMFYGCSSLQSLDVSGFDTKNVKDMSYIFSGCTSLQELNLGNITMPESRECCFENVGSETTPCTLIVDDGFDLSVLGIAKTNSDGEIYYEFEDGFIVLSNDCAVDDIMIDAMPINDGNIYNIFGQRVSDDYKGIIIKNGKKYLRQ